jgi:hypothetical protein
LKIARVKKVGELLRLAVYAFMRCAVEGLVGLIRVVGAGE